MCEYCEQIKNKGETVNLSERPQDFPNIVLAKHRVDNKLTIEIDYCDDGEQYWVSTIGFSYCPFCGNKIGD